MFKLLNKPVFILKWPKTCNNSKNYLDLLPLLEVLLLSMTRGARLLND